ncbi:MAG: LysM peptidoglycan-binding domain-containing protein [Oscillospiraceae bacterium]|jgi:nucleoid-associated protein YgaU|nr:LysM peptidoglycan-binding domain-containing protein [Oscillospiraceae bacterium]
MMIGLPNPNFAMPVAKLCITNTETEEKIYVLYNPESYTQGHSVEYNPVDVASGSANTTQYVKSTAETLAMQLFFDTFSASAEAGGTVAVKAKLGATSLLPSAAKQDVRDYTKKVYGLMNIDRTKHRPPLLKIEWGSLVFQGYLAECTQKFTKFNELGKPVRAVLDVRFIRYIEQGKAAEMSPNESPDTAKYRTVHQGDALWALAVKEYGLSSSWRMIADANKLENPRILNTGDTLRLPAEK